MANYNGTINVADSESHLVTSSGQVNDLSGSNAVAITNGVGTFQVQAGTTVGNTQTLTPSALSNAPSGVNIDYSPVTITQTAPTAASVQVQVVPGDTTYLSANSITSTTVQYALLDSAGQVASSLPGEYETFTISGPGSFADGSSVKTETLWVDGSENQLTVYSEQGQAGTITVSASGNGISGQVQIPSYINTAPASLSMTSKQATGASGNPYTLYTVQLLDSNGHPVYNNSDPISVTNNAAAPGAIEYGTINSSGSFVKGPAPTALTDGQAQFAVRTVTEGTSPVTITVQDTNPTDNFSASANYDYVANAASTITMTPASSVSNYTVEPGQQVTYSAQLTDAKGNDVAEAGQTVTFGFKSNGAGATFPNGLSTGTYTATTNSQGVASVTVTVPSGASGSFQLQGMYNSNMVDSGTTTVVTAAGYGTQVALAGQPKTDVTAGSPISGVTANVENAVGTPVTGGTLLVTTSNSNVVAVNGSTNGPTEEHITDTNPTPLTNLVAGMAGTATITVQDISDPAMPKASFTVNVVPGTATNTPYVEYNGKQVSSANPLTVTANQPVPLTVVNVDAGGNPVPVAGSTPLTVDLFNTSGGQYRLTPDGADVTDVNIPAGQTSATVYYVNPTSQTITSGMTAVDAVATQSTSTVKLSSSSVTAGQSLTISGVVNDQAGNPVAGAAVDVSFDGQSGSATSSSTGTYSVTLTPTKAVSSSPVTVTANGTTISTSSDTASVTAAVSAAQNIAATETSTGANVTWTAPATGTAASYQVWEINTTTGTKTDIAPSVSGSATSYSVRGLTIGDSYEFNVDAVDQYGNVVLGTPSSPAFEYGTLATGAANTAFSANTSSTAGSATFTVTMDKSLPSQTPTLSDFTVKDTTGSITYTVTGVTVSGKTVTITTTIPAGTVAAATDTVVVTGTQGALTDSAGAPSAAFSLSTTN